MLVDLFDADQKAIAALLAAAITSIRADAKAIGVAACRADLRRLSERAHRLKGTSGTIGDRRLLEISTRIEDAARNLTLPQPPLLAALREAVDALGAEIAAVATPAAPAASNARCV
jgi:HPt (histidine-containing phosphotransfer) domain-containing protein